MSLLNLSNPSTGEVEEILNHFDGKVQLIDVYCHTAIFVLPKDVPCTSVPSSLCPS